MKLIQLKSIKDLVMLIASSTSTSVVQHFQKGGSHIYFIIGGTLSETFLYFVREEKALSGSFLIYHAFTGDVSSSDKLRTEPNVTSIPLIDIQSQDIFTEDMLARAGGF